MAQKFERPPRGKHIAVSYGYQQADNGPLSSIIPVGMEAIADDFSTLAISGYLSGYWLTLGLDLWFTFSDEPENDSLSVNLGSGGLLFMIGYKLVNSSLFLIAPRVGIGLGSRTLHIRRNTNPALNDIRRFRGEETDICTGSWLLDVGLSVEIRPVSWSYKFKPYPQLSGVFNKTRGFTIAIQTGYMHSFAGRPWKFDTHELSGVPEYAPSGLYVRLGLGYFEEDDAP